MEDALRRRAEQLAALQETLLEITGRHELAKLLNSIVERAAGLLNAPSGGLYICDPDRKEVRCVVAYNTKVNPVGTVLKYGEGAAGVVAESGKPLLIDDYSKWSGRAVVFEKEKPFRAVLSAPMFWKGQVTGVVHILRHEAKRFTEHDLELLAIFANHAAIAVENARLYEQLDQHAVLLERMVKERTRKLEENENLLRLVTDSVPALVSYLDADLRYKFTNKAYEEWFGKPTSEIIGRHARDVLGEATYQRITSRLDAALSGKMQSYDYELPHRSLGTRHVTARYVPDFGANGQVRGIFVLAIDVTDRKRIEVALQESEQKYRELFEASPISLWEEDFSKVKEYLNELRSRGIIDFGEYFANQPDEISKCAGMVRILNVNRATLKLYEAEDMSELRGSLRAVLTEESSEVFGKELAALAEGKTSFASEIINMSLRNETKHVSIICTVVPGYEETLAKVLVSIIDLTPRKKLEMELRAARDQLDSVLATNPAVLYVEEPLPDFSDTISTFVSESARTVLGFESKRFLGESGLSFWRSRLHPDDLARYWEELPLLWLHGQHTFEYRFLHSDGHYRWITEQYRVIRDAEGRILNAVAVAVDVTERKEIEEKLAKAERLAAIGQLAAMVGHDLRNPMQGITNAAYLLRNDSLTREERNEALQLIDDSVEHSNKIVGDLLDYSREIHLELTEATPREITRSALEALRIPDTLRVQDHSQSEPVMIVDSEKLRRAFMNLITNAVDAMPKGGTITISSKESNGSVQFSISDTGTGIPKEILENPWKPLQTTKAKGMGLGLPIVKRIIDAHGGEITAETRTGAGTTFVIRLPIKPKAVSNA
jgi:PAS domain S-box-containing protein